MNYKSYGNFIKEKFKGGGEAEEGPCSFGGAWKIPLRSFAWGWSDRPVAPPKGCREGVGERIESLRPGGRKHGSLRNPAGKDGDESRGSSGPAPS